MKPVKAGEKQVKIVKKFEKLWKILKKCGKIWKSVGKFEKVGVIVNLGDVSIFSIIIAVSVSSLMSPEGVSHSSACCENTTDLTGLENPIFQSCKIYASSRESVTKTFPSRLIGIALQKTKLQPN